MPTNTAASKIGNGVISLLWQLWCHCNPDHNKFSSLSNTTGVAIFTNVSLWRRSLCSKLGSYWPWKTVLSHFICQYDLCCCIVWPSFLFDCFVKIWANCKNFLGKWFTFPLSCIKLPVRLSSHEKPITKCKPPRGSFTFGLLLRASSWQFLKSGAPGKHNSMLCELY